MKYTTCPHCGSNLDFGERCDCQTQAEKGDERKGGESDEDGREAGGGATSRNGG